jgi:hypothetical protein
VKTGKRKEKGNTSNRGGRQEREQVHRMEKGGHLTEDRKDYYLDLKEVG